MKLIFLYSGRKANPTEPYPSNWADNAAKHTLTDKISEDGITYLWFRLIETGVFDSMISVIGPFDFPQAGSFTMANGNTGYVIPHTDVLYDMVEPGDVIFVRGRSSSWTEFLAKMKERGENWIIYYDANTNCWHWEYWDIVFNDLCDKIQWNAGRGYRSSLPDRIEYPFLKPVNPNIFYPQWGIDRPYDFCVGASHIFWRKRQWLGMEMIEAYEQIYGIRPKCVMPGKYMWTKDTDAEMIRKIDAGRYDLYQPGFLTRAELCNIYNQSKVFLHLASGGQNDRSYLESMQCGTPVMFQRSNSRAPFVQADSAPVYFIDDITDIDEFARNAHDYLNFVTESTRRAGYLYFQENSSFEHVIMPRMTQLFELLLKYDPSEKEKVYGTLREHL